MIKVIEETISSETCIRVNEYNHESIDSAKEHIDIMKGCKNCYIASSDPRDIEKRRLMNLSKAEVIDECLFAKEMIQKEIEEGVDLYCSISRKCSLSDEELEIILRYMDSSKL